MSTSPLLLPAAIRNYEYLIVYTGFRELRASDPNPNEKHQNSSDNYLKSGAEKRCVHITVSNPADCQKFNCHDHNGDGRSGSAVWNQIGQRMPDSSGRGHQSADKATQQRFAAAGQAAVIRSSFSKPH